MNTRAKWSNDRRKSDGTGRLHAVGFRRIAPIQFRRRRRARGCARMLSPFQFFFFFLDSGVLSSQKFQILAYLLFLSLFLHLFSHSHRSRFPRRHVTDTGRRHSRNRSSTRYFQKINRLTQREENIVRLKCGYLVIPRPHVVRLVISPSLLLSLFLFLYVFIVIN